MNARNPALGSALRMLRAMTSYWLRCASSAITTMSERWETAG